jgi:hypothetical protein
MPAAMASTFFSAPQISTPITSCVVLTRIDGPASSSWTSRASFASCVQHQLRNSRDGYDYS